MDGEIKLSKKMFLLILGALFSIILFLWFKPNNSESWKDKIKDLEKRNEQLLDSNKVYMDKYNEIEKSNKILEEQISKDKKDYDSLNNEYNKLKNKKTKDEISNRVNNLSDDELLKLFSKYK